MPLLENAKHERFAQALAAGKNAVDAYEAAGYRRNRGHASTLRKNPKLLKRVDEILESRGQIQGRGALAAIERVSLTKAAVLDMLAMLLDHSTRRAFPRWRPVGRVHQGVLIVQRGDVSTGLRLLRAGVDELSRVSSPFRFFVIAGQLAQALGRAGQIADGLAAVEETIARSERTEERWAIAEFLSVKGELLLLPLR